MRLTLRLRFGVAAVCLTMVMAAGQLLGASTVLVATGDSITNGYSPGRLAESCGRECLDVDIVQIATGGLTAQQYVGEAINPYDGVLRDYAAEVIAELPDVICFMLGTNDAYKDDGADARFAAYKTQLTSVFDRFAMSVNANGDASRVIVSTLIPILVSGKEEANARIDDWYNPWLRSAALDHGFQLLDLNTEIQEIEDWQSLYSDGIHLWANSGEGYVWMGDEVATAVVIPEPTCTALLLAGASLVATRRAARRTRRRDSTR